ncbi:hypothetical protein GTN30_06590 [Macrococcoides canis]|uniref:Uncharacterized protein n=1 Tax=Macrococcoides canis TaxID=1855823 RepID=A0AAE6X0R7_9STAP|nr:hypothetical protein [Macrococcus canis]QIH78336.1 hypothetical protein GTN30_06590 [Macrococcus canis]
MRSYELITQDEMLEMYMDWNIRYAELSFDFGRRAINIISEIDLNNATSIGKVLTDLDEIFGLEEIFMNDRLISCVVNE